MNIKVWDDKYVIKSDQYCYKVAEIKKKISDDEEGDVETEGLDDGTYEVNIGFVNNVAQCFRLIVEKEGRQNKCSTLNGYIRHIEEVNKKLENNIELFSKIVGGPEMVERAIYKVAGNEGDKA